MGLEANSAGDFPKIASTAFVHPTATVIGRVSIGERTFVGPNAVLRADEPGPDGRVQPIVVGEEANIQDCAVVHALGGAETNIGPRASVAHAAVIHGPCRIGADCLIGFSSVVFNATLGVGVVVTHQALVEGVTIPSGLHVPSMTAVRNEEDVRRLAHATREMISFAAKVSRMNVDLVTAALNGKTCE